MPLIIQIKFFKNNNKINDEDDMKYQFVPAGKDVFVYGDIGDLFYIILHGEVGVLIPKTKQEIQEEIEEAEKQEKETKEEESPTKFARLQTRKDSNVIIEPAK